MKENSEYQDNEGSKVYLLLLIIEILGIAILVFTMFKMYEANSSQKLVAADRVECIIESIYSKDGVYTVDLSSVDETKRFKGLRIDLEQYKRMFVGEKVTVANGIRENSSGKREQFGPALLLPNLYTYTNEEVLSTVDKNIKVKVIELFTDKKYYIKYKDLETGNILSEAIEDIATDIEIGQYYVCNRQSITLKDGTIRYKYQLERKKNDDSK